MMLGFDDAFVALHCIALEMELRFGQRQRSVDEDAFHEATHALLLLGLFPR